MPAIGTSFQPIGFDEHLWVVISEENDDGEVLCVNITDAKHYPESTCHLGSGDHPFIIKPSVVVYKSKGVRLWPAKAIDNCFKSGSYRKHQDFKREIIERIINGAFKSDDMPPFQLVHVKMLS
jgi:hypothetical protein